MSDAIEAPQEEIFARGKLFELVHVTQPDGRVFEVARRAPGVRLIIDDPEEGTLLLTREYRRELDGYDYRLPGGKVYDTLKEYDAHRTSGEDILQAAFVKGKGEGREEAGIDIEELKLYGRSILGATIEWDLFLLVATKWRPAEGGQQLEHGEDIQVGRYKYADVWNKIISGQMQEERVALRLMQWLVERGKINV